MTVSIPVWEVLDAAYRAALEDAPLSAPEHRIGRLAHVCSPREGWPPTGRAACAVPAGRDGA